eukprot:12003984-Prorocentrum_lima.AAC.1
MAHRTLQDARALLELQDHLSNSVGPENDADREAQHVVLTQELEAVKSMVASRDMLAAQWGLGALLGEQSEFSGMRIAHDMLNARVRVTLGELNDKIKALLLMAPPSMDEPVPDAHTAAAPICPPAQ